MLKTAHVPARTNPACGEIDLDSDDAGKAGRDSRRDIDGKTGNEDTGLHMMSLILGAATLVAVLVVAVKLIQQKIVERSQPGRSPGSAIPIEDYGDMDLTVRLQTCACGGRYLVRGEGSLPDPNRPLRIVYMECRRCERERRLYFDLSRVRH